MRIDQVESRHSFELDDGTGLLSSVILNGPQSSGPTSAAISAKLKVSIEVGVIEQRSPTGGLEYINTHTYDAVQRLGEPRKVESTDGLSFCVPVSISGTDGVAQASMVYRLNRSGPALSVGIHFPGGQPVVVRNVKLQATFDLGDGSWALTAPGNCLASSTPLETITDPVGLSAIGGLRGASGLVHVESSSGAAVALWFDDDTEVPDIEIVGVSPNTFSATLGTNFAADLSEQSNDVQLFSCDLSVPRFAGFPEVFASWMRASGLTSPGQPPEWVLGAMIFEAQIGFSVFEETRHYSPYPEVSDLIADLDRIQSMGFSVIQLMPRQPYPSYNVHDYWDIDTSYGPIGLIKDLVTHSHQRGMRVIFDVLLHGVLDQESIQAAADGVRGGPFADLIASETSDSFGTDVNDWRNYLIAWSRHIGDFEPYWKGGSPPVSPLIAQHPDWFCRDSNGNVSGVYTKAFDARNREWQDYFTNAMSFLMTELDIDGFRFDAPTYNEFANWAPWARGRASTSQLACVGLFERLRPVLKNIKSDALLYTEPSGHALRKSMDLNYNYDEQWLLTSLAAPSKAKAWGVHTGKSLAVWMRDRDALLPAGSLTAHHMDSHDTFWWPSWGKKWRREQFTMDQVRMFTLVFGGLPGPLMFSGGELGIEDLLPALAALKRGHVWRYGSVSWWTDDATPDSIFGITRVLGSEAVSLVVNVGDSPVSFAPSRSIVNAMSLLSVGNQARVDPLLIALGDNSGAVFIHTIS
jgi:glycosidase